MAVKNKASIKRLRKHIDFLSQLSKATKKKKREQLLSIASSDQIQAVIDCIKNVLRGSVPVDFTPTKKRYLRRFKQIYSELLKDRKRVPINSKKRILIQKGGFLTALLPPVIAVAGSLLGDLLRRI